MNEYINIGQMVNTRTLSHSPLTTLRVLNNKFSLFCVYKMKNVTITTTIMMLLAVLSFIRAILTVLHFHLISSFVLSKPPGRKMVVLERTKKKVGPNPSLCFYF